MVYIDKYYKNLYISEDIKMSIRKAVARYRDEMIQKHCKANTINIHGLTLTELRVRAKEIGLVNTQRYTAQQLRGILIRCQPRKYYEDKQERGAKGGRIANRGIVYDVAFTLYQDDTEASDDDEVDDEDDDFAEESEEESEEEESEEMKID